MCIISQAVGCTFYTQKQLILKTTLGSGYHCCPYFAAERIASWRVGGRLTRWMRCQTGTGIEGFVIPQATFLFAKVYWLYSKRAYYGSLVHQGCCWGCHGYTGTRGKLWGDDKKERDLLVLWGTPMVIVFLISQGSTATPLPLSRCPVLEVPSPPICSESIFKITSFWVTLVPSCSLEPE